MQLYDRLKEATMTDDSTLTHQDRDYLDNVLTEFMVYIKKAEPFMKKLKDDLATYLSKKQQVLMAHAGMQNILTDYEQLNLTFYSDNKVAGLVFLNEDGDNLSVSMRHTVEKLRNPFTELYHWLKGEMYDIAAFSMALKERATVKANLADLKKKVISAKADIEHVTQGKKTMNTLFKNSNDVGKMQGTIESMERDQESQEKLLDILSLYLGRTVLPKFKGEKLDLYKRILQQFHVMEINNAHNMASFWHSVMRQPIVKNASRLSAE